MSTEKAVKQSLIEIDESKDAKKLLTIKQKEDLQLELKELQKEIEELSGKVSLIINRLGM